jgi:4-amino-4-deoxy-L-arabinose transferase-like glycosyltransferase
VSLATRHAVALGPPAAERGSALARALRRHWPIVLVLVAGVVLRVVVMAAYDPVFWFTDTGRYLHAAEALRPDSIRPWGYSGMLWLALRVTDERGVAALQHGLVVALAALVYAFLVRRRVAAWLAALAVLPLALSPLVVNIEHHLLSDALFTALVTASAVLLAWPDARPALWVCALAGLSLALAVVTRQVALALAPPLVAYLVARRSGWLRLAVFGMALAVPVLGYLSWVDATHGVFGFSTWTGKMLYARVAPIAECAKLGRLTAAERRLCESRPPSRRPGPSAYIWTGGRGAQRKLPDGVVLAFAKRVIERQPGAYVGMVAEQSAEVFRPGQHQRRGEACVAYWTYPDPLPGGCRTDAVGTKIWRQHPFAVDRPLAHGLHLYERLDAPIGPFLLACLLVTVFAVAWRPRTGGRRLRLDAAMLAVVGLGLTVAAIATAMFSYRYTVPLYSTVPPAAALALTQLARARSRGPHAHTAQAPA